MQARRAKSGTGQISQNVQLMKEDVPGMHRNEMRHTAVSSHTEHMPTRDLLLRAVPMLTCYSAAIERREEARHLWMRIPAIRSSFVRMVREG